MPSAETLATLGIAFAYSHVGIAEPNLYDFIVFVLDVNGELFALAWCTKRLIKIRLKTFPNRSFTHTLALSQDTLRHLLQENP